MDKFPLENKEIPLLEPPLIDQDAPRRILYVLFKRKRFIGAVFLVLSLPLLIYALLQPTEFVGAVKVLIKPTRAYLNMTPTVGSQAVNVHPSPQMIATEIEIIQSKELRRQLVKEVPFPVEGEGKASEDSNGSDGIREAWKVAGSLRAGHLRNSNLIQITAEGTNPEYVAKVVNKAAELYMQQHLKVHKVEGIEEFYDEQEKALQLQLTKAETALEEFQKREGVVDVEKELASTLTRLSAAETSLQNTESSLRETSERVGILEAQIEKQRENVQAGRATPNNPVIAKIRERLVQLELEKDSLLQRYTKKNRLVMDKEREIAELKDRMKTELRNVMAGDAVSLNSIHDSLLQAYLAARAEFEALKARRDSLSEVVATLSSKAAELRGQSYRADRLQQEVNAKKAALALYRQKAEEARISDAMDEQNFGNATILEWASLPLPRAGVKLSLIVFAIFLFSAGAAVAGAFVIEFFNSSLRNESDVESQTGLPVLATIQDYGS